MSPHKFSVYTLALSLLVWAVALVRFFFGAGAEGTGELLVLAFGVNLISFVLVLPVYLAANRARTERSETYHYNKHEFIPEDTQ
jgi:hypothetical protein